MKFFLLRLLGLGLSVNADPNYKGCTTDKAKAMGYCDSSLSIEARLDDLQGRLSLEELVFTMSPQVENGDTCDCHTGGIDSVDLPQYMWLVETNTNVASACLAQDICATTFVGPVGMGASFNRTSWRAKGSVLGNEMRAMNNIGWHRQFNNVENSEFIGLTGYGPNINIARDPRFGRNSELPGEDPFLSGSYATEMLKGMQEEDENGHPKMLAYVKHLTAYSTETNRGHDDYTITDHDLWDTYLPAYKMAFTEGAATGAMCSYNAINGVPSCVNDYILNDVVRGMWSPDAHVTTDCNAISNLMGEPINAPTQVDAVALALNGGTDIEMGSTLTTANLVNATESGLVSKDTVIAAWRRSFKALFRAGRFDQAEEIEWSKFGEEQVNSTAHQRINYEAALQSIVLLKNEGGLLPLAKGSKVAVVGPMANAKQSLLSSYASDEKCFDQEATNYSCITSFFEGVEVVNAGGETKSARGVDINSDDASGVEEALALVRNADVAVVTVGIDKTVEKEGTDRTVTALPGLQEYFVKQVLAIGKPVILVLVNGGALAIDDLVAGPGAIIETFNPNVVGAKAFADQLFGEQNKWGKMPVTMYPHEYINQQELTNFDMAKAPGRTHRYYTGETLFKFGHGLSLTEFDMKCEQGADGWTFTCDVENVGKMVGDEVVFAYHLYSGDGAADSHPVPLRTLKNFERITISPKETGKIEFTFTKQDLELVNEKGEKVLYKGDGHKVQFWAGEQMLEFEFGV